MTIATVTLTDTQREILTEAAQRPDGVASFPARLKGGALAKTMTALLKKKLVRAARGERRGAAGGQADPGHLMITDLGLQAVGRDPPAGVDADQTRRSAPPFQSAADHEAVPVGPRQGSKLATVLSLLSRRQGASLTELATTTAWLPHTTRAALTGLRRRGYAIARSTDADGVSRYRIAAARLGTGHNPVQVEAA